MWVWSPEKTRRRRRGEQKQKCPDWRGTSGIQCVCVLCVVCVCVCLCLRCDVSLMQQIRHTSQSLITGSHTQGQVCVVSLSDEWQQPRLLFSPLTRGWCSTVYSRFLWGDTQIHGNTHRERKRERERERERVAWLRGFCKNNNLLPLTLYMHTHAVPYFVICVCVLVLISLWGPFSA